MALGNIGKDAVPALIQTLQDQNWDVRGNAANTLGEIEEEAIDAVPALITGVAE
jgi:HEAT repeat protein